MTDDLVKELRASYDPNDAVPMQVCLDAADRIKKLEMALRSIAANACCDSCREAALVARKALERKE